jgi:hypothetical protein
MGYLAPINTLDVSNSNAPNHVDSTNPVASIYQRAIGEVDPSGNLLVTPVNSYSGNNGREALLANGHYYIVGNAGNGSGDGLTLSMLSDNTGVQMIARGDSGETTVVGQANGAFGSVGRLVGHRVEHVPGGERSGVRVWARRASADRDSDRSSG